MADDQQSELPPADGKSKPTPTSPLPERKTPPVSGSIFDLTTRFTSSGLFFMIVGAIFLYVAFNTMGRTHAAMSFVFVVVGVAILLYGTGTQGIGDFDSGERAEQVARYRSHSPAALA